MRESDERRHSPAQPPPLIVNAPGELREALEPLTDRKLIDKCARLQLGAIADTVASTKHARRALATRWLALATESAPTTKRWMSSRCWRFRRSVTRSASARTPPPK